MRFNRFIEVMILSGVFSVIQIQFSFAQQQKQLSESLQKQVEENLAKAKAMESSGDYNQAGYFYNNAATTYWTNGLQNEAINNFQKVICMYEKIGNRNAIKNTYSNIGMVYIDMGDYTNALSYFEKCLSECRNSNKKPEIASALINIANTLSQTRNYDKAIKTLEEATSIASELNDIKLLRNIYSQLAEDYEKMGNTKKSSEYFALYTTITRKVQKGRSKRKRLKQSRL